MADPLSIVLGILQLMSAAKSTIGMLTDVVNAPKEQRSLFTEVGNLELLLKDLQAGLEGSPSAKGIQRLHIPLDQFKETMEHVADKLRTTSKSGSKVLKALIWTLWNKKEAEDDFEKIERFKGLLNTWLVLDIWDANQQQQRNHERTETEHAAVECKKIIEWISLLNFFQRHDDISHAQQNGMAYGYWRRPNSKTGSRDPGSAVVDYLREKSPSPNVGVACTYLNHKEMDMQSPENILAGLWRQIMFAKPILLGSPAHSLYQKHHETGTQPSVDEMHALLSSAVEDYSKVYIVIDALDEYPETKHHALLKHLAALRPNINLLFTSWPHIPPKMFFPNTPSLEIRATEEDIHRYLDAQIQNSFQLSKHVLSRPELHQEIENQIIGNVDGMFLLAKLRIDSLTIKTTIKAVPQSQDDRNIAKRVLIWIANAKRPLSVAELQEAIAIEPGTKTLDQDGLLDPDIFLSLSDPSKKIDALVQGHALLDYSFRYYLVHAAGPPELILWDMILTFLAHASRWLPTFWPSIRRINGYRPSPWNIYDKEVKTSTDLFISAIFNLQETAKYLLAHDTSIQEQEKAQSLIGASQSGSFGMLHLLISQGVNMNAEDGHFGTALQAASSNGHEAVVQLLLNMGADVNAQGGFYGDALQAASKNGNQDIIHLLLDRGADMNAEGGTHGSALQAASFNRNAAIVKLLLDNGASMNAQEVVQLLLDMGADVNAVGGEYGTALQAASLEGHEVVVQLLLDKGGSVSAQGQFGTALQAASRNGHEAVVQLLLVNGALLTEDLDRFGELEPDVKMWNEPVIQTVTIPQLFIDQ
ncbi:ankyrin repeat-containing domain protein [Mycena rebaudengoi]|nr:ankyrin repeat-containing domain protein [Mycena rebaudengoi]